jgi:hypothetical protein
MYKLVLLLPHVAANTSGLEAAGGRVALTGSHLALLHRTIPKAGKREHTGRRRAKKGRGAIAEQRG